MSRHDWRNWETCTCGEPGCRSSYPNRKWARAVESIATPKPPEGATLYIDGKRVGVVDGLRFVSEENGIEQWEMRVEPANEDFGGKTIDTRIEGIFTASVGSWELPDAPPKRPPNPERPMWAIDPARMRRNAFGPSRKVK